MTQKSVKTLVNMIWVLVLIGGYLVYLNGLSSPALDDLKSWGGVMLVIVGIAIGGSMLIHIVFQIVVAILTSIELTKKTKASHDDIIVQAKLTSIEDERDKLIDMKASFVGFSVLTLGVVGTLIALACGLTMFMSLNILMGSLLASAFVCGILSIIYYERGMR